jgi:fucose 4-O-acetylase-like acetyltransferase
MNYERQKNLDLISGLFMIQIITMHIFQFAGKYQNDIFTIIMHISFFFMPWFYFKSGFFLKSVKRIDRNYILDKSKKILIPFISFTIIGFIIALPFEIYEAKRPIWKIFLSLPYSILWLGNGGAGNLPIWFLLSLFFAFFTYILLDKLKFKWLIVLFPIFGYLILFYQIKLPLGLNNLFLAVFFIYIGNIFIKIEHAKYNKYTLPIAIIVYFVTQYYCFSSLDFRTHEMITGNYFVYVISSISGLVLIYYLAKLVNSIPPINYIGKNSLIYFIAHWPIIILANNLLKFSSIYITGYVYAIFMSIIIFVAMPFGVKLFNNKYKTLIGK